MSDDIVVTGATAPSGKKYYVAAQGANVACIPKTEMTVGSTAFINRLTAADITLFTNADKAQFLAQAKAISQFPPLAIAEQVGWNGNLFAMPDGSLAQPLGSSLEGFSAFIPTSDRFASTGSLKRWKADVAEKLSGQLFGELMLIFPFVSPLLRLNPSFENFGLLLVAAKGKGKTTLLDLSASVVGGVKGGTGQPYWHLLSFTLNALEDLMEEHRDHPLMLDDSSRTLATMDKKQAGQFMTGLAYLLEGGQPKARLGNRPAPKSRFAFQITANASMLDVLESVSAVEDAALDRLLTLRIPDDWEYGTFKFLPDDYDDAPTYAAALKAAAIGNHGHAFRKFVKCLVQSENTDPAGLRDEISSYVAEFKRKAGPTSNEGTDHRIVLAFAAIYVAGKLAQKFRVIPASFRPGRTALQTYRLHMAERQSVLTPLQQLERLARSDRTLRIDPDADRQERAANAQSALATIYLKDGHREMRVSPKCIEAALPGFGRGKQMAEFRRLMLPGDGGHLTAKSVLAPGMGKMRLYRFRLPGE